MRGFGLSMRASFVPPERQFKAIASDQSDTVRYGTVRYILWSNLVGIVMAVWQVQEAKTRLSEVIEKARTERAADHYPSG